MATTEVSSPAKNKAVQSKGGGGWGGEGAGGGGGRGAGGGGERGKKKADWKRSEIRYKHTNC